MSPAPLRIFISRELASESVFRSLLEEEVLGKKSVEIVAKSCLSFSPISFLLPEHFDAICFYSQKGFDYFLQGLPTDFIPLPSDQLIAFGRATGSYMEKNGWSPNLIGNGIPEELSSPILDQYKGKKILFPQAKFSKNSLQPFLENELDYRSLVVYANNDQSIPNLGIFDALVFTSPKNAVSFSKANTFGGKIVAIGAATAAQLLELTELPILMADHPYEADLAKAVLKALEI